VHTGEGLPEQASVHLDRAYGSNATRQLLAKPGLIGAISEKGKPASLKAGMRWVVKRTNSWQNAHKKLMWCTERRGRVIDFWIAFTNVIIVVRRLTREPGLALVGNPVPRADHDLLAEALSTFVILSLYNT
jgi:hypothetical protein